MALDNVTSHFPTMLEPIASASFLSSLSMIHDEVYFRGGGAAEGL